MNLTPDVAFSINPWLFAAYFLLIFGCIGLIRRKLISKQHAEKLIIHLEYTGTILIGLSVIGTGVKVGSFSVLVQLFPPWPGILLIGIAYQFKLAVQNNRLSNETPQISVYFRGVWHRVLDRFKWIFQKIGKREQDK